MRQHVNIKMSNPLLLHKPQYHKLDGKTNLVVMPLVFYTFYLWYNFWTNAFIRYVVLHFLIAMNVQQLIPQN